MASFQPFQPFLGQTQAIVVGSAAIASQTLQFKLTGESPSLLATLVGLTAGTVAYLRVSVESSTVITATAADCPIVGQGTTPTIHLFGCPSGTFNIAVVVTTSPSTAGTLYLTPGQGGVGF